MSSIAITVLCQLFEREFAEWSTALQIALAL
jgi:hypothetical protein